MEDWWRHKLFQPKNIEGEPVTEELSYIRELFNYVSEKEPRLKGIAVIGSTLKGYSRQNGDKRSDIDIIEICDDSTTTSPRGMITYDFLAKFHDAQKEFDIKREKEGLPNFKTEGVLKTDINQLTPERIKNIEDLGTLWTITGLVFPGAGDLETYRKIVRDEINKYPKEEKEKWLKSFINYLEAHFNSRQALERGMIKKEDEEDFLRKRKELLNARVRRVFG
ncbi:MAG: hypothetical protein V4699_01995 [Patescibacteria group bacterium]